MPIQRDALGRFAAAAGAAREASKEAVKSGKPELHVAAGDKHMQAAIAAKAAGKAGEAYKHERVGTEHYNRGAAQPKVAPTGGLSSQFAPPGSWAAADIARGKAALAERQSKPLAERKAKYEALASEAEQVTKSVLTSGKTASDFYKAGAAHTRAEFAAQDAEDLVKKRYHFEQARKLDKLGDRAPDRRVKSEAELARGEARFRARQGMSSSEAAARARPGSSYGGGGQNKRA